MALGSTSRDKGLYGTSWDHVANCETMRDLMKPCEMGTWDLRILSGQLGNLTAMICILTAVNIKNFCFILSHYLMVS